MNAIPVLEVSGLTKTFSARKGPVLQSVSLTVAAGECLAVLGRSGAGKSTLARCLTGLLPADAGTVKIDGRPHQPRSRRARLRVQMVWQDSMASLSPFWDVRTIVGEPLETFSGLSRAQRDARILELLALVGLSPSYLDRRPHQISGGEAQRIGLARALAAVPRVLILDEPLSALDPPTQVDIIPLVKSTSLSASRAVLLISHDLVAVRQLADRVLFLDKGRVVADQRARDFFDAPAHPAAESFLKAWPALPF